MAAGRLLTSIQTLPRHHTLISTVVETTLLVLLAVSIAPAQRYHRERAAEWELWTVSRSDQI